MRHSLLHDWLELLQNRYMVYLARQVGRLLLLLLPPRHVHVLLQQSVLQECCLL
jgi:hypothetical protein